ncbi:hypothetical protein LC040_07580 [Bacillus tianshenii]|nr:hypothetical protein LC040_07580 [Bacillus tianshenii]
MAKLYILIGVKMHLETELKWLQALKEEANDERLGKKKLSPKIADRHTL